MSKELPKSKPVATEQVGYKVFEAIGRFSVKYRWFVLIVWILAVPIIVHNLPSLTSVTQSDNSSFLPSNSPTEKALNLENAFQPSNLATVPVVITSSNGPLSVQDEAAVSSVESSLAKVATVKHVVNRGVSADGEAEIVEVQALSNNANMNPDQFVDNLRSAIASVSMPSGLSANLTGPLAVQVDNSKGSSNDNKDLQIGTVIFIVLLLLFIFRAPLAPIITLIPPVFVVTAAGPLIAEASKHGLKVSSLAQLLLTVLVLGAGTDYGLFLIFRVREELQSGLDHREAIIKSLSRVGESITFSAATVVAALLSLLLASFQIYSNLGIPLAIGVALMLLAGLTLLPALLAIFGRAVFWPMKPKKQAKNHYGIWGRVCARVVQRPVAVLVTGIIVFGALALAVPGYEAGGFGGSTTPPSNSDSAKGNASLSKHFPGTNSNPTEVLFTFKQSVWTNPSLLLTATNDLKNSNQFNSVSGPLNPNGAYISPSEIIALYNKYGSPQNLPPKEPAGDTLSPFVYQDYRATANYISHNGKVVQYAVGLAAGDPSSTKAMKAVPAIRDQVNQISAKLGATNNGLVGEASAFYDISYISNQDLIRVIPVAVLVIGILLGILMRSLVAPLYLVFSVVLSYLAALGLSVLIFMDIAGSSGIVFILPFLMFIFLLALGEDYNILVMTRIREEAHGLPLKKAVTQALNTTGTTVTSAGLVLAGTFTVLGIVGGQEEVRDIGFGLAIGILMDTFLVRTLLVPSIVVILGKWNWWPTKHGSWADSEQQN